MWRLLRSERYESTVELASQRMPGVRFRIKRISVKRRNELAKRVLAILPELEHQSAGETPGDQMRATALATELTTLYLSWGLEAIEGLLIDGRAATSDSLLESGPEELCDEVAAAIRRECGLTEEERKN